MIDQRSWKLNEATEKHAESAQETYQTVWDFFAEAQERQTRSTRGFFKGAIANLGTKVERNLDASEELVEQARRGQEAARLLARESANAYTEFLNSLFLYYRESMGAAGRETPSKDSKL